MSSSSSSSPSNDKSLKNSNCNCGVPSEIDSICIGSGRFLRAVLVPALIEAGLKPMIVQTRGQSFQTYCRSKNFEYEVDTVQFDGEVVTEKIPCFEVGSLGTEVSKQQVLEQVQQMRVLNVIGVGVTEAGLASPKSKSLFDLTEILRICYQRMNEKALVSLNPHGKICVINTDNVPMNGSVIFSHILTIASTTENGDFIHFLKNNVSFHNTMVDRITSQREGSDGLVPKAEPVPAKALVIEDLHGNLPASFHFPQMKQKFGVIVRSKPGQLNGDIALKLRVANGTHTAVAHVMALSSLLTTDVLAQNEEGSLLRCYIDAFFESQILPGATNAYGYKETKYVYNDWRRRLTHAHFGLSTFFITQNGAAKAGIRIGPTIQSLIESDKPINVTTVFALAAILRFLTPSKHTIITSPANSVYRGWLDGFDRNIIADLSGNETSGEQTKTYADGMAYNLLEGWYEFKCVCDIDHESGVKRNLPELLLSSKKANQPCEYEDVIRAYFLKKDGGNMGGLSHDPRASTTFQLLVSATSTLYARMVAGDRMLDLLQEMMEKRGVYKDGFCTNCQSLTDGTAVECMDAPLHFRTNPIPDYSHVLNDKNLGCDKNLIRRVVFSEVSSVETIDLHTHLLPPSHGALCLWGIDELLTYHYLVAEYFITAPSNITPEKFFKLNKQKQADMIWQSLFVDKTPISEACRGVITTLTKLGLDDHVNSKNLDAIRNFFDSYRKDGLAGTERYCEMVYEIAGVKYAVMTNIPFDANEAQHWRPKRKEYRHQFKSALRVDPLLAGDRKTIETALAASGYENTLEATRRYLHDWCDTMKPEYMMASTPHDFVLKENNGSLSGVENKSFNVEAMKSPFAFVDVIGENASCIQNCDAGEDATASVINESSDFLGEVLMKVCEERDIPIALKIGAHRAVNPSLQQAGDGIVAFADASVLSRLCTRFPKVRFLATFLSRNNQHEACVLASKFRNLHIYGCWWFCNNPSMIEEITKMRVEMLGTAFTAQHSDSRVIDQLIYKWAHSRCVIANVLTKEYAKLSQSGWKISRQNIRDDVKKLFGGSYEDFMQKSLV